MNNTHYVYRLLKPKAQCAMTLLKMGDKIPETCRVYIIKTSKSIPYFTDYKTHFFLRKIASKIQVRLILEINIKMSSV
jgi:hypothetical protein